MITNNLVVLKDISDFVINDAQHYADPVDYSTAMEHLTTNSAIAQIMVAANRPETHPDFDGVHCVECDQEIPAQRLAMLRVRCTHCQSILEYRNTKQQRG